MNIGQLTGAHMCTFTKMFKNVNKIEKVVDMGFCPNEQTLRTFYTWHLDRNVVFEAKFEIVFICLYLHFGQLGKDIFCVILK